jgi:hypothetical protein
MARVLVVAADADVGARATAVAERDGHDVIWCGGPHRPDYICAGGRGEKCALTDGVAVVVVDGWLDSDVARCGTPSWHLISYYRGLGIPVLALVGPDGLPGPLVNYGTQAIPREADPQLMRQALHDAIDQVPIRRPLRVRPSR